MIALLTLITFNFQCLPWGEDHSVSISLFFNTKSTLECVGGVQVPMVPWRCWDGAWVAVCHHCRCREFSCYRPSPKLRCASKLNGGHWWSVVVLGIWHVLHCFCPFSQQNMDGPTKIPSRLAMACRWRSPLIWGVQTAVLVWPHAWRFLVGPWDLCHYR